MTFNVIPKVIDMKLKCCRFDLSIEPVTKLGPEGWLHFHVKIMVPGFNGEFDAEMQIEDLKRFKKSLNEMDQKIGSDCEALLGSVEPGIYISLKSDKLGRVFGKYQFESERCDGEPTCLSGAFEIDQTFVKPLAVSVSGDIKRIMV